MKQQILETSPLPTAANGATLPKEAPPGQSTEENLFASVIGAFKDDSMLDDMMANIRERRREMDANDGIA